jgi:cytochrome c oxidase assembly protein subunit 15
VNSGVIGKILGWLRHPLALRRAALASVIANVGIIITGGAVRLTGSGLGCPTWPTCTADSLTTTPEMGIHGAIEYGNRMLTGVVGIPAVLGVVIALVAVPRRTAMVRLATAVLALIGAQAVLGGITVRTGLNPWTVSAHFMLSIITVATAYALWVRGGESDGPTESLVPQAMRTLGWTVVAASVAVLMIGTIVTGSGPHSGDPKAMRNGIDSGMVAQLHADAVCVLLGLTFAMWLALKALRSPGPAVRAAATLLAVELAQGLIGFVQFFTHLPVLLVGLHMAGAAAVWLATLNVHYSIRTRGSVADPVASEMMVSSVPLTRAPG